MPPCQITISNGSRNDTTSMAILLSLLLVLSSCPLCVVGAHAANESVMISIRGRNLAEKATKSPITKTTKSATLHPSASPSISQVPTKAPSESPSQSHVPTVTPTASPTLSQNPSSAPSGSPSLSMVPSSTPSGLPSGVPTVSLVPSSTPSESPSISSMPSPLPSGSPSVSLQPSLSASPSETPSTSPTAEVCLTTSQTLAYEFTRDDQRFALAMLYYSLTGASQSVLSDWLDDSTDECNWSYVTCDGGADGSVIALDFTNLELDGTIPTQLEELTALTTLTLTNNPLVGNNLEALGDLDALLALFLDDNNLTSLPTELGKLNALTELDLKNNQFTNLPSELGNLGSLKYLYLQDNTGLVTPFPSEICALESQLSAFNADCGTMADCCS